MPVIFTVKFWSAHKTASISVLACILEIITVWGIVIIIHFSSGPSAPPRLVSIASSAWILGSIISFIFAVMALFVDKRREVGFLSLGLAAAVFIVCGLPLLV